MGLESATYINQLVITNPVGGVDDYATADDHLRLIKAVLKGQFPNFTAVAMNASIVELNKLVGFTGVVADLNILSGAAAGGLTAAELLFVKDVTSAIQAQLNGKAPTAHSHDTAEIANNAITLPKLLDIATASFLGRLTAATGDPEVLTAANARTIINVENGAAADQTAGEIEAIVSHDNLVDFLAAEHVDWAATGAEDVHVDRFTNLPAASETGQGIVERANQAEVDAGTDTTRYVSPATLRVRHFVKTANESVNNSIALQDDDHFTGIALTTGKYYALEALFQLTGDPGDFDYAWTFTNAPPIGRSAHHNITLNSGTSEKGNTPIVTRDQVVLSASLNMVRIHAYFRANVTTGGTFKLRWAQGSVSITSTTMLDGSWMRVTRLN